MSQEINYRFWNTDYVKPSMEYGDTADLKFVERSIGKHKMLLTKLVDKNGNGIYEGDILIDTLTNCQLQVCFGHNRNGGYVGWYVSFLNIDKNGFSAINGDYGSNANSQIGIIGNIYETYKLQKINQH
jgi:hypothetical protein